MKLRNQLLSGYSILYVLMVIIAVIAYTGFERLSLTGSWVAHTHKVISQARFIEKTLIDMETGLRGYLITGDNEFLAPYEEKVSRYKAAIDQLKITVTDNPTQKAQLERIEKLVKEWQDSQVNPAIELRKKVKKGAVDADYLQEVLSTGIDKALLDEMRKIMDRMIEDFNIAGNVKGDFLVETIHAAMVEQSNGQRGFLITGEDKFLEPFDDGKNKLAEQFIKLRVLVDNTHDRIVTTNYLNDIKKLANKWEEEVAEKEIYLRGQLTSGKISEKDFNVRPELQKGKKILDELRTIMDEMDRMFAKAENDKADVLSVKMAKSLVDKSTAVRGYLISGDENFLRPYYKGKSDFIVNLTALQKLNSNAFDVSRMKSNITRLEDLAQKWLDEAALPEIDARREMNKSTTSLKDIEAFIQSGAGKLQMANLRQELADFVAVEDALLTKREEDSAEQIIFSEYTIIFGTSLAIIIGIFTMLFITKKLIAQVGGEPAEILSITQNLATGNLDTAMVVSQSGENKSSGIYASVQEILKVFKDKNDFSLQQDWLKSGQNRLNDKLSGELGLMTITDNAIQFVSEYVNAQIGAVYVSDNKGKKLNLMGSYAFTRRKGQNNQIAFGEGLVGEAAKSQKSVCVSELPDDYTAISSATGQTLPKNLLVVPLLFEGKVKGVMELGSVEEFKDIELEFIESISQVIASSMNSAQTRQQVEDALGKSQSLAEELQSQQEELKVANEELTEQTEALKESEERLTVQSEELRVANEELTEKTEALDIQKKAVEDKNKAIEAASKELERKAQDLEIASKYKSEFLANMSHELRTPLNSLLILSESLSTNEEGNLTEDQIESINVINSGGKDLLGLINDILDLSKVEAGKLDVHLDKTEVAKILQSMKRQFQHVADQKSLDFHIEPDEKLTHIYADKKRVEQIIKNLLSNAFKFTSKGSVTLKVSSPKENHVFINTKLTHNNCLAMTVTDTGIGIPQEKQQSIFEAFQQADGSTSRKFGGTGLGLTISRELCRLMNGEVSIESKEGQGSSFTFFIPLADADIPITQEVPEENPVDSVKEFLETGEQSKSQDSAREKSILIIEDDLVFSKVLRKVVESKGYKALSTDTGMQGLTLAKLHYPDAILLDLGLPDIDGKQVLEQLKFNLNTRHIPVHIISGRDTTEDLLAIGAVGHLTKPVEKSEIEEILSKIEGFTGDEERTILVVDDDDKTLFSIKKLIARESLKIITSQTASDAKDAILNQKLDCVILDLSLPDMSGFELLEKLTDENVELPPVIVYTGKELTRGEYNKLNEMAKSIVIKGAESSARLLDDVSLFLHSVEKRMPEEQQKIIEMLHDKTEVLAGKKILVVDDDSRNVFAVGKLLQKNGMKVVTAENGQVAVEKVGQEDFDAVLMDIMMPVMDGYEATQKLREMKGENLPIIAFTAKAMSEDREKCIAAGANDYITKPLDSQKLLSLLSVWLFQ